MQEVDESARDTAVQEAVEDLAADFERTGRPLEVERIERLVAVRKLAFAQVEEILDALAVAGVPVLSDDAEVGPSEDAEESKESGVADSERDRWREVLNHGLLNAQTEIELGRAIAAGRSAKSEVDVGRDSPRAREAIARAARARDKLATSNLRLVWGWASKYAAMTGMEAADLFQDGVIGLLRAVDGYDAEAGFRFSTYAVWWIRQAIQRSVADKGRTVRVPVHVHEQLLRLKRATQLLWREKGSRPSLALLAQELGCDREHAAFLQGIAALVPVSLDAPVLAGEGDPLVETVASNLPTPEELAEAAEIAGQVRDAIDSLPTKMKQVISRRHGIGNGNPETLERIGTSLGLTRERVRQIETAALRRLKKTMPARLGLPPIEATESKTRDMDRNIGPQQTEGLG